MEYSYLDNGTPIVRIDNKLIPNVQFGIIDNGNVIFQHFRADIFAYSYLKVPMSDFMKHNDSRLVEYTPLYSFDKIEAHKRAVSYIGKHREQQLPSVFGDDFVFWCLVGDKYWDSFASSKVGNHYKDKYREGKLINVYHHAIAIEQDVIIHFTGTDENAKGHAHTQIEATSFAQLKHPILVKYDNDSLSARWATRNRAIFMLAYKQFTKSYNLITNNCEHFATLCRTGIPNSQQVKNGYIDLASVIISLFVPQISPIAYWRIKKYF